MSKGQGSKCDWFPRVGDAWTRDAGTRYRPQVREILSVTDDGVEYADRWRMVRRRISIVSWRNWARSAARTHRARRKA